MKRSLPITLFCILFLQLALYNSLYAVPAYPHPVEYTQPNGQVITIQLKGDEKINWAETATGYTILVTQQGEYQYATLNENHDLVFSGIAVSPSGQKSAEEKNLLGNLSPGLFYSKKQIEMMQSVWKIKEEHTQKSFPATGDQTLLCILMETPDKPFTKTQEDFNALFNQLNYTFDGASGSLKDYYLENSYGQLNLSVDVYGPYTASESMEYYGSTWNGARFLATEAANLADADVNFADYDNTNNGWVDSFYMIFAGYGEEAGGGPNTIWSHAWSIEPVSLDGVWVSRYACSPELRNNWGSNITRIGVVGHEFGHSLGAPDYYDTGDNNFQGTGSWDMMAGGTWNNGGATPAHHNAFTKIYFYNWAMPTILNSPLSVTLTNSAENSNSFYRINTNTTNEYYLLENRQKHLFDAGIPGSGMIIYHVHSGVMTAAGSNTVNNFHPQRMYPVSANATMLPNSSPSSYGDINAANCAWTGAAGKTEFTDTTIPNAQSWAGVNTEKPITNISRNATQKTVSFDFMGGNLSSQLVSFSVSDANGIPLQDAAIVVRDSVTKNNDIVLRYSETEELETSLSGDDSGKNKFSPFSSVPSSGASSGATKDFGKNGSWMHWDNGDNTGSIGLNEGGIYLVASRWTPEDLSQFDGLSISSLKMYVNNVPTSTIAKVWQGNDASALVEVASQVFTAEEQSWVEVVFDQPYTVNLDQELWFGYEIDDPGEGVFTAGRDNQSFPDGKGNKVKLGADGEWVNLSSYNLDGMWNLQAFVHGFEETILYTDASGQADFEGTPGNYSFDITKEGYLTHEGAFVIEEDDLMIEVTMYEGNILQLQTQPADAGLLAGAGTYETGHLVYVDAEANFGFEFVNWTDSDGNLISESPSFTYTMPDVDAILFANFETVPTHTLSLQVNPEDAGTAAGEGIYELGQEVTIATLADDGYLFVNWTDAQGNEVSTESEYTFTMPDNDVNLIANYLLLTRELSIEVQGSGDVHVNGDLYTQTMSFDHGTEISLTALAAGGFQFDGWSGDMISQNETESFTLNGDVTIIATFISIPTYTLSITVDPANAGEVSGEGVYVSGELIDLQATADDGFVFVNWTLESGMEISDNIHHQFFMPDQNTNLKANFQQAVNVDQLEKKGLSIFPNPARDIVKIHAADKIQMIRILDISGKVVYENLSPQTTEYQVDLSGLANGMFVLHVLTKDTINVRKLQLMQ